jgi:hypothetical protein
MTRIHTSWIRGALAGGLLAGAFGAAADDRGDYNRRAAADDTRLYQALDRNGDGRLDLQEVQGDLNLGPRFNDMDIDRNSVVTPEEFQRYLKQRYEGA